MMANKEEGCNVPESPRLRLHVHPGTSGLAPHMALLAAGADFEVRTINLFAGEGRTPAFLRLNPFGTVPVLEEGDTAIPETGAILLHVAERFPDAELLPRVGADRAQALRWLFHVAALHADFMTWRRASFALREDQHGMEATQAWMAGRLAEAFRTVERADTGGEFVCPAGRLPFAPLARPNFPTDAGWADRHVCEQTGSSEFATSVRAMDGAFLVGTRAGPADFYLLMVAGWWRKRFDFAAETPRLAAHLQAMTGNPSVRGAYEAQGSDLPQFLDAPTPAA